LEGIMTEQSKKPSLKELESEVLAEGREWTRQRLQQRLQAQAEEAGAIFPPQAVSGASPDLTDGGGKNKREGRLRSRPPKR
jgi:hypothetical protein